MLSTLSNHSPWTTGYWTGVCVAALYFLFRCYLLRRSDSGTVSLTPQLSFLLSCYELPGLQGGEKRIATTGRGGNLRPKNNDRKWAQNVLGSVHRPRLPETAAGSQKHTPDHPASNSYWGCGYFCLWCMTNNQRKLTSILLTEKSYQWAIPEGITSGEPGLITQVILSWGLGLDIGTHDSTQIGMSHGRDETHVSFKWSVKYCRELWKHMML